MRSHVVAAVRSCFVTLRSLMPQGLLTLVHALVISNFVLAFSTRLLDRLQPVLDAAAWLMFSARQLEQINLLLHELNWLPVLEKIRFRFRCFHSTAPSYLADSLRCAADVNGRRHLRSANTESLIQTLDDRLCFSGGCG